MATKKPLLRPRAAAAKKRAEAKGAKTAAGSAAQERARKVCIRINGAPHELEVGSDIDPTWTLAYFLKERLGLTGLKISCNEGACGACTVIMDGAAVLSCMMLAIDADGHEIETIEGVAPDDPVIQAFANQCEPGYGTALQCGYCTPGFVMTARAFLRSKESPTAEEIRRALSGNICRCGCYAGIARAVEKAAAVTPRHPGGDE